MIRRQAIIWTNNGITCVTRPWWVNVSRTHVVTTSLIGWYVVLDQGGPDYNTVPASRSSGQCEETVKVSTVSSVKSCGYAGVSTHLVNKQRVLMHGHQRWNVRHGLCHIYMIYIYIYIYIYIWVVYSLCFFCCLSITVTWWYVWCTEWASGNQEEVQACLVTLWLFITSCYSLYKTTIGLLCSGFGNNPHFHEYSMDFHV